MLETFSQLISPSSRILTHRLQNTTIYILKKMQLQQTTRKINMHQSVSSSPSQQSQSQNQQKSEEILTGASIDNDRSECTLIIETKQRNLLYHTIP